MKKEVIYQIRVRKGEKELSKAKRTISGERCLGINRGPGVGKELTQCI